MIGEVSKMAYKPYTETLQEAIDEAERFITKAMLAIEHEEKERSATTWKERRKCHATMYRASAKRASMDLTRVLVDVRGRRRY